MTIELIIAILSSLGIGGVIGAYINHLLEVKRETQRRIAERKENEYKTFLENLLGFFEGWADDGKKKKFMEELYSHAPLYASDEVIKLANAYLRCFYKEDENFGKSDDFYKKLVLAIRKDLEGVLNRKSKLTEDDIDIRKLDD